MNTLYDLTRILEGNGFFDTIVHTYTKDIENRLNNLITSETVDEELIDIRYGADGVVYESAGDSVRKNILSVYDTVLNMIGKNPENIMSGVVCYNGVTISDDNVVFVNNGHWCTDYIPIPSNNEDDYYIITETTYKYLIYDVAKMLLSVERGKTVLNKTMLGEGKYMRVVFEENEVPYAERFKVNIYNRKNTVSAHQPNNGGWFDLSSTFKRGYATFKNFSTPELYDYIIRNGKFRKDMFVINGVKNDGGYYALNNGKTNLVFPYYVEMLTGTTLKVNDKSVTLSLHICDRDNLNGVYHNNVDEITINKPSWVRVVLGTTENATINTDERYVELSDRIVNGISVSYVATPYADSKYVLSDTSNASHNAIGKYVNRIAIESPQSMSDHTFINNSLYILNASDDEHTGYKPIGIYDYNEETGLYERTRNVVHNLGHGNSIDYCAHNDMIIMGNGGQSETLEGEIIIVENASTLDTWEYNKAIKIPFPISEYGFKVNVVWGEANAGKHNIVYAITNNMTKIYKLLLTKTADVYDGFIVLNKWESELVDVCQGMIFYNGKLYCGCGHNGLWVVEITLNKNGTTSIKHMNETQYNDDGSVLEGTYTEGITIHENKIYCGLSDGYIYIYEGV